MTEHGVEGGAGLWVVTELHLSLPAPPPSGEPHPERAPIGPFGSRDEADRWAFGYVRQLGGNGSWGVAPLSPPTTPTPPASGEREFCSEMCARHDCAACLTPPASTQGQHAEGEGK